MFKVRKKCGENFVVGLKIKQDNLWKSFRTTFFGLFSTVFSIVVGKILVRAPYSFSVSQQNKNKGEKKNSHFTAKNTSLCMHCQHEKLCCRALRWHEAILN